MSQKILGIDLGTSSIGISLRNPNIQGTLEEQLEYFSVEVFKAGVGKDKSGEYSFAAHRSSKNRTRRLYDTRRRRLWATLQLLIDNDLCPLTLEDLNSWRKYDKASGGYSRQYPANNKAFESWIRLDFNGNGKQDFETPYHLRRYLTEHQLDMTIQKDRFMLGRALYHMAQRRGFKSSKGDTASLAEDALDNTEQMLSEALKASEREKGEKLYQYMQQNNFKTVACAFADMIDKGERVRASEFEAIRSDYKNEIIEIFNFQSQLSTDSTLFKKLISEKKDEGTIFYKKPLASQKGSVGKCTLEKDKRRCPISHPIYEEFRALSFINNIRIKRNPSLQWENLTLETINDIYKQIFISKVRRNFKFKEIRIFLEKTLGITLNKDNKTVNYSDDVSISGCPITARFINLMGENWKDFIFVGNKQRLNERKSNRIFHTVKYTAESIWNFCFNADEIEDVEKFASEKLGWNDIQIKKLIRLWDDMQQGYAMLSRKAMENIIRFLKLGLKYPDAVLLAKIPYILAQHDKDITQQELNLYIKNYLNNIKIHIDKSKTYAIITNSLIAKYKALNYKERFADHDYGYTLKESDFTTIEKSCAEHYGEQTWANMSKNEKNVILTEVAHLYEYFFSDPKRDFIKIPRLSDAILCSLKNICPDINDDEIKSLYHPSMISVYQPQHSSDSDTYNLLGSPNIGSIKNPVAMRTLNILQKKINQMIAQRLLDPEETRVIIETTRRKGDILDDANVRKAITNYQTKRQTEREKIKEIILSYYTDRNEEKDIDKALYMIEQKEFEDWQQPYLNSKGKFDRIYNINLNKYKLWLEQDCCCIYTGRHINIHNLFNDSTVDIEHTIPRSISFDNSDKNLTVCDRYYNRQIKKNKIPTELPNYRKDAIINGKEYTAILPRLKKWEDKVKHLESQVLFWKRKSSEATTKERKDFCIVNKLEWQMELEYWRSKLDRFMRTDVPDSFRNSQLVDTGVITRHSIAYLKSVFNNVIAEKGSVTADFRKILGIQSIEEKKDRSKHSHHAIDAIVLTLIPVAGLREKILKLYYQKEELLKLEDKAEALYYSRQLEEEIKLLNIGSNISHLNEFVENNILIHHRINDRTLQNAKRRKRIRGKVVTIKNKNGEETDKFSNGDSIRLEISAAGNLGAIVLPDSQDGKYMKRNGKFIYTKDEEGNYSHTMVQRVSISSFKTIKELEKIIDPVVKQSILTTIELQQKTNPQKSIATILSGEIRMRDKQGRGAEIYYDRNGKKISPIRHVRCKVAAGRGFLSYEKAIRLREQKNLSTKQLINLDNREHKKFTYSQSTGNYLCLIYEGIHRGNIHREFVFITNYEVAKLKWHYKHEDNVDICTFEQLKNKLMTEKHFAIRKFKKGKNEVECKLTAILKSGDKVLKWNNSPDELNDLSKADLLKRLYVITKFNTTGANIIYIRYHLISEENHTEQYTSNNFQCLIEHRDFEIELTGEGDTIRFL